MKKLSLLLLAVVAIGCGGCGGGDGENSNSGSTPVVTALAASSITPTSAILNGTVIPNGLQTQTWFEYGTDSALATYTSSPKQDAGNGLTSQAANMTWNGLAAGTTYYYRFCAENSKGSSKGLIISFTISSPGSPPTVTTLSATSVGATEAILNENVNPNGLATTAWFEWGIDPSMTIYSNTTTLSAGSGTTSQLVSIPLIGLSTGTTYYYRVASSNSSGTSKGSILSFVPGAAPTVTALAASPVGATTATLNGSVTANGLPTIAWFEWGIDNTFAIPNGTPSQAMGSGTASVPINANLTGLTAESKYYYRVVATNSAGTSKGATASFITNALIPTVTTNPATSITATTALLHGTVNPNRRETDAYFEWGTSPTLSTSTTTIHQPLGSGSTDQSIEASLIGLTAGTTYYYRVKATNSAGTSTGTILGFTFTRHQITGWPNNKKGAVSLTFDDGNPTHLSLGIPALDARGMKGTFFVITDKVAGNWGPWMNASLNGHEIGSHTLSHPYLTSLTPTQAQVELQSSQSIINSGVTSQKAVTFAYPYGDYNSSIMAIAQNYYIAARGVYCGLNQDPPVFYNVGACSTNPLDDVYAKTDAAEQQGKWMVFFTHSLDGTGEGHWLIGDLEHYLDYLKNKNLWVGTFGAAVKYIRERMSATLSVFSVSSSQIVLSLTDALDDAIYDQPLTIHSEVPSGWDNVTVQQGSSITEVQSHVEGATKVIIYNAVPDRGLITLRSSGGG